MIEIVEPLLKKTLENHCVEKDAIAALKFD
jgi:hypothetical protein